MHHASATAWRQIHLIVSSQPDAILTHFIMPQPASAPIEESVIDVLKSVSRRPIEPTLQSDLIADLGFDSLQVLELIAELEDRFDISIPLNDVPATRTVAQVVAQVARLVEERPKT
jgi:acyl carrier protein